MKHAPNRRLSAVVWNTHKALYLLSGKRLGRTLSGMQTGMLTTTGGKSGQQRRNMLTYITFRDGWALVASNRGADWHPGWWFNLQAGGPATFEPSGKPVAVRGRKATKEERAELWPRFLQVWPDFDDYVAGTTREIPVVVLERA